MRFVFLALLFVSTLVHADSKVTKAIEAYNFDFDDNIFSTGAQIHLVNMETQERRYVSTAHWAVVRQLLGKKGEWQDYRLDHAGGLIEFGDEGSYGNLLFKTQIEDALKKAESEWRAPSFEAFRTAMADPAKRAQTTIITARLHAPESISKGMEVLKSRGLISQIPIQENLYVVGWKNLPVQFRGKDSAESKVKVMEYLLDKIQETPVPDTADLISDRDGTGVARLHRWGFSDDDFGNYMTAFCALSKEVAKGRWSNVKIVLFHTGKYPAMDVPRSKECESAYGPIDPKGSKNFHLVIMPSGKPRRIDQEERKYLYK